MISDVAQSTVLQASAAVLSFQHRDYLGEPAAPAGTVTVTITTSAGTAIVTDGATTLATDVSSYTMAITDVLLPDQLTATWTDDGNVIGTTTHDVVGGFYCDIATDLRTGRIPLKDATKHPTAALRQVRWEAETQIERYCNRAFVPRFRTEIIESDGSCDLRLSKPDLNSVVWANYWTGTAWAAVSGTLSYVQKNSSGIATLHDAGWERGLIQIGYRYGWTEPGPELKDATIQAIKNRRSDEIGGVPRQATSYNDGMGQYQLATPGVRNWVTADPVVDEVLNSPGYKFHRVAVA